LHIQICTSVSRFYRVRAPSNDSSSRQIATFFLGWLFLYSIQLILCSEFSRNAFCRLWSLCRPSPPAHSRILMDFDQESNSPPQRKTPPLDQPFVCHRFLDGNRRHRAEDRILILMLAVCFACASIAYFASLLHFSTSRGGTACGMHAMLYTIGVKSIQLYFQRL
jgi:hypothetical protein